MTIVTLCTELGSIDEHFAAGLARRLGTEIVDHRRFERDIAEGMDGGDGEVLSLVEGESPICRHWNMSSRQLARQISEEILEVAARGNVLILGSGAAVVLRCFRHVLSVRVRAPMEIRERNVMKRLDYSDRRLARWEIENVDAAHARFIRRVFGLDWQNPDLYDLIVNPQCVPAAQLMELLSRLAQSAQFEETPAACAELADRLRAMQMQETESASGTPGEDASMPRIEQHLRLPLGPPKAAKLKPS